MQNNIQNQGHHFRENSVRLGIALTPIHSEKQKYSVQSIRSDSHSVKKRYNGRASNILGYRGRASMGHMYAYSAEKNSLNEEVRHPDH